MMRQFVDTGRDRELESHSAGRLARAVGQHNACRQDCVSSDSQLVLHRLPRRSEVPILVSIVTSTPACRYACRLLRALRVLRVLRVLRRLLRILRSQIIPEREHIITRSLTRLVSTIEPPLLRPLLQKWLTFPYLYPQHSLRPTNTDSMAPLSEVISMLTGQAFGKTWIPDVDLKGKTIVVTGANTGLGLECVKHL